MARLVSEVLHPQERIEYEGFSAEVDKAIAPLILDLWRAGCDTLNSCQDNRGEGGEVQRVWIHFVTVADAERFMGIAAGEPSDEVESLYSRIVGEADAHDWYEFRRNRAWSYDAHPEPWTDDNGRDRITLSVSIRFPFSDYQAVLDRVHSAVLT
jgi:hypothetical protein